MVLCTQKAATEVVFLQVYLSYFAVISTYTDGVASLQVPVPSRANVRHTENSLEF